MTTDGIRTHACNNLKHTLASKSLLSFNAGHSAILAAVYVLKRAWLRIMLFFQNDRLLTISIGKGKFLKTSQEINKPPHELHHTFVMIVYPQNIAA